MYLVRNLTDYSYPAIARVFGGRDHTTVIHAVEKITGQMKERRQIYEQVTDLLLEDQDRSVTGLGTDAPDNLWFAGRPSVDHPVLFRRCRVRSSTSGSAPCHCSSTGARTDQS